jgi:competence protein ComEC
VELSGRVVGLAPVGERTLRLVLDDVELAAIAPQHAPRRIELRMPAPALPPRRGAVIRVHALLYPPAPPLLPGTYDHARTLVAASAPPAGPSAACYRRRADRPRACRPDRRSARCDRRPHQAALPGPIGAFAEAQITGERGHLPCAINEALQISRPHPLSPAAYGAGGGRRVRGAAGLPALSPRLAETRPIKAWAAIGALLAAAIYLALSGGGIATWRSAIMIVMMFAAVLLERPALRFTIWSPPRRC